MTACPASVSRGLGLAAVMAAALFSALGCTPTVKIEAPDKPIVLKIDLNIKHELMLRVEKDLEQTVANAPMIPVAKKGGWIGERLDGYLGLVREDTADEIRNLVLDVNEERRQRYMAIAEKHKLDVETVESIAGQRLIDKSAPGEFVQDAEGKWVKKGV